MGPHGLVVGATGSGESELLRTVVLGLAMTHPPEHLNMVLVDVEGGGTFSGSTAAAHVRGDHRAGRRPRPRRPAGGRDRGELHRRTQLLRTAGTRVAARLRRGQGGGPTSRPAHPADRRRRVHRLPATTPDALDLFRSGGRAGRSLGVHLLSRPADSTRAAAAGHLLSYRTGAAVLRGESRIVLGGRTIRLPTAPGTGYLTSGTTPPVAFRAAYVSGPVHRAAPHESAAWLSPQAFRLRAGIATEAARPAATERRSSRPGPPTDGRMLDVAVSRLTGAGRAGARGVAAAAGRPAVAGHGAVADRRRTRT